MTRSVVASRRRVAEKSSVRAMWIVGWRHARAMPPATARRTSLGLTGVRATAYRWSVGYGVARCRVSTGSPDRATNVHEETQGFVDKSLWMSGVVEPGTASAGRPSMPETLTT